MRTLRLAILCVFVTLIALAVVFPPWKAAARQTRYDGKRGKWVTVTYKGIIKRGTPIGSRFAGPTTFTLNHPKTGHLLFITGSGKGGLRIDFEVTRKTEHDEKPAEENGRDHMTWGVDFSRLSIELGSILFLIATFLILGARTRRKRAKPPSRNTDHSQPPH